MPDLAAVRADLQKLLDAGIRTLAIVFMHAYAYPEHEVLVGNLAREMGFEHVSLSAAVMPMAKVQPFLHSGWLPVHGVFDALY